MSTSNIIFLVLLALIVAALPNWKHSRIWGGGCRMSFIAGLVLAIHGYTVMFVDK